MHPIDDPSWPLYPHTVAAVGDDPPVRFLVTTGPTAAQQGQLAALGLPTAWAIVTPCNPRGRNVSAADNAQRVQEAQAVLHARGIAHWPGDGGSTDGAHAERGFAVALDREAARRLAEEWEQSAFFWIDGGAVWLCPALVAGADERLTTVAPAPVVLFGATSFASLAHHLFRHDAHRAVAGFAVDRAYATFHEFEGLPVVPFEEVADRFPPSHHELAVAVGFTRINGVRRERFEAAVGMGYRMASHVSRRASVWEGFVLRAGCSVYEGAIVQAHTTVAEGVVIRAGANVGHHSAIGCHAFIASGVVMGGNVRLGEQVMVGLGATIRDNVTVADRCLIGAGAVVLHDTEPDGVYVGNPARRLPQSSLEATSPPR